jgi:Glycosyl transferases group 1
LLTHGVMSFSVLATEQWPDLASFYLPDRDALRGRDALTIDPDRDWEVFGTGVYIWIFQTFLRLYAAGAPVRLDEVAPVSGLVVVYADHVPRLYSEASSPADLILVSVRADRRPQLLADVEIVQNASSAGDYQIFIPSWLQPGLIPRDPFRGTRVEVAAYMGTRQQLHDELATPGWADYLRTRGLHWDNRMVTFIHNDQLYPQLGWNDYSGVDVVVALRPPAMWNPRSKPAAKLQNAWAAGVPAILSPEVAYRELRRSRLDYLEARSSADVLAALERLKSDPDLYRAMIENGLERAREFQPDRVVARWTEALWSQVPARAGTYGHRLLRRTRSYRALARRARNGWRSMLGDR